MNVIAMYGVVQVLDSEEILIDFQNHLYVEVGKMNLLPSISQGIICDEYGSVHLFEASRMKRELMYPFICPADIQRMFRAISK